ncbi:hypothetical protein [Clostridium estertheticum]|uniref:hypothetical protein n=1 Tax=Clostridium estertheticum TaxID=238834 RepID=UPI001C7CF9FB|nr:hypothetical protein [Clostridium estertheticum]MBX4271992.1 hypothetical protein [Clostridium estertheticum]WLC82302.1 hypothetical protein KTC98_22795 [Clostridium estertheticum]
MNNMSKEREKWNKQKSMGKLKFVLFYGVLLLGVCSSILCILINMIFNTFFTNSSNYTITGILVRLITRTFMFGLFGIFLSIGQWNSNVKKFDIN